MAEMNGTYRRARSALPVQQLRSGVRPRIALYSHDTMGLGHVRRNLLIAQTLASSDLAPDVLLITGAPEATSFALPSGVDVVSLPTLHKSGEGLYRPRQWSMSLEELTGVRSSLITAAVAAFRPDMFVVDNVPRGADRELDPVLTLLQHQRRTRVVLGLRDVLDDPETIRREWARAGNIQAIRKYYDGIWIYGDPAIYDPVREYGFPRDIAERVQFTGYLDQRQRLPFVSASQSLPYDRLNLPPGELILCMVGGGQDGTLLAEAFAEAELPAGANGVILAGPHMPAGTRLHLQRWAELDERRRVIDFLPEPGLLLERADRIITMGGYNSVSDVLSYGKPALVVPRVHPRREQIVRAERLRNLGYLDMLRPEAVTPRALTDWLRLPPVVPVPLREIDLHGLERLPFMVQASLESLPVTTQNGTGTTNLEVIHAAS